MAEQHFCIHVLFNLLEALHRGDARDWINVETCVDLVVIALACIGRVQRQQEWATIVEFDQQRVVPDGVTRREQQFDPWGQFDVAFDSLKFSVSVSVSDSISVCMC